MDDEVPQMLRCAESVVLRAAVSLLIIWTSALGAQSFSDKLAAYSTCSFSDGLQIVQIDPLAPGITSREVETDSGSRQIDMLAGTRIMFAYPNSDFYANVKAEL